MNNEILERAIQYAKKGFYIFPCYHRNMGTKIINGKEINLVPKSPCVAKGVYAATTDLKTIEKWWKTYPKAMIGCNLGMSNRFVVDVDNKKINGFDTWNKLGIVDDGCSHVITPGVVKNEDGKFVKGNAGLHIYFFDPNKIGRPTTNKKDGIDTRGNNNSYTILPFSIVEYDDGTFGKYIAIDDMFVEPKIVTREIIQKIDELKYGKKKEKRQIDTFHREMDIGEEYETAKKLLFLFPFEVIDDYDSWLHVAMYLRKFGDVGKKLFFQWTEEKYFSVNPNSKRKNLEYKWDSIANERSKIGIGTLFMYAKQYGVDWKTLK